MGASRLVVVVAMGLLLASTACGARREIVEPILRVGFDGGRGGFVFSRNAFPESAARRRFGATGRRVSSRSERGGYLSLRLRREFVERPVGGGWKREFRLERPASTVRVLFRYRLFLDDASVGSKVRLLVEMDGADAIPDHEEHVLERRRRGGRRRRLGTEWRSVLFSMENVPAGPHAIAIGGRQEGFKRRRERATVFVDDVGIAAVRGDLADLRASPPTRRRRPPRGARNRRGTPAPTKPTPEAARVIRGAEPKPPGKYALPPDGGRKGAAGPKDGGRKGAAGPKVAREGEGQGRRRREKVTNGSGGGGFASERSVGAGSHRVAATADAQDRSGKCVHVAAIARARTRDGVDRHTNGLNAQAPTTSLDVESLRYEEFIGVSN